MFTDKQLARLKPGMHADGHGLYIRVRPTGKKTWVKREQRNGKDRWVTLGEYPRLGLAEARRVMTGTVGKPMGDAIAEYLSKLSVVRKDLVAELLAPLRDELITVTRAELVKKLQKKSATAPVFANRMLTRWKDFFNYCEQCGYVQANPIAIVQRKFIGGKEKPRNRVLSWEEIEKLQDPELMFILISGLRPTESLWVAHSKKTTGIPNKRTAKDGYLHDLPHSHFIRWAIKNHPRIAHSDLTLSNRLRRKGATFTPHDLRRTMATRLGDLGVLPYVVEKLLGHKMQGVMAVYNHAEYWPERIAAQRKWDRALIALWRKKSPD